jgi:hypothetical protein
MHRSGRNVINGMRVECESLDKRRAGGDLVSWVCFELLNKRERLD